MCPRDFDWKDVEDRHAIIPLIREVARPDVSRVAIDFDETLQILWVRIWWAPGTPEYERPEVLKRCAHALSQWRGLHHSSVAVIVPAAVEALNE